jgi:hypothetical protein
MEIGPIIMVMIYISYKFYKFWIYNEQKEYIDPDSFGKPFIDKDNAFYNPHDQFKKDNSDDDDDDFDGFSGGE